MRCHKLASELTIITIHINIHTLASSDHELGISVIDQIDNFEITDLPNPSREGWKHVADPLLTLANSKSSEFWRNAIQVGALETNGTLELFPSVNHGRKDGVKFFRSKELVVFDCNSLVPSEVGCNLRKAISLSTVKN